MSDITLRLTKGSPLTNQEVDDNFENLNTDKYQSGDSVTLQDITLSGMSGAMAWNADEGALDIPLNANVTLQTGQEFVFYAKATEAISNGQAVMFAGAQGGHLLIAKCDMGAVGFDPTYVVGIATQDMAINDFGYVTSLGKVRGLDTSAYSEGDILYIDPTVSGALTATKPAPPNHIIQISAVVRSHANQGTLLVRATHTQDTDEIPEGSTNQYFTDARAISAIQGDSSWNATNWDTAFGWGDHSAQGYLTSVAFADLTTTPTTISGYGITDAFDGAYSSLTGAPTNVSAFTNDSGYLTSYTETDPVFTASTAFGIDSTDVTNWNTAFGWGNHASAGYLTSFTETDPTVPSHVKSITTTNISNWNNAFGWGDHSAEGYLTTVTSSNITASGITDGYVLTADGVGGVAWEVVSGGSGSTISGAVLNDGYTEEVSSLSGTDVTVSPDNGTIQTWSLTANSSWDVGTWGSGQTVSLIIEDNGYTLTNPILSTPISNPFGASAVADGSTHTLPTGSEGELVVLFVADDTTVTAPTGWTQVGSNYETASTADLGIFYKTIGTGETTVSLNQSTLASVSFIFGGDPEDLVFTNTATGASASPNPPSASMTEGNYSLVFGFMDDDNVTMSAPTGYTLIGSEYYPFDVALAVAYKLIDTTGTEDPSAFGNSGSDTWNAGTLELSGFDTTPIVKWQDGTEPTLGTGNTVQLEVLKVGSNYYGTVKEFS